MSTEYKLCACPLDCFDVCSIKAEIKDGKVIKLEGNKEHPITQGFICEKGRKHLERMYSPLRIKRPMKKVDGAFVEISWDEAFDIIDQKLRHYISSYGTLSIAQYNDGGAGGLLKGVENLFFDYLGDTTRFKGSLCWAAGMAAQRLDFGAVKGHSPEDLENAKTIVIWGRNPVETNMHLVPFLKKAREKGTKIVLIDPIVTASAAISDWHIQLKPGGDWAFAASAAKFMMEHALYDKVFVEQHTMGFEELKTYLDSLDYPLLFGISGANMELVESFVKAILDKPATIYVGYGVQRYKVGGAAVRCIDSIGALAGIIGIPGGGVNYANSVYGTFIDWSRVSAKRSNNHRYVKKPNFAVEVPALENPKVKAIFISRANPAVQLPNTQEAVKAISEIEFKVVLDYFMNDTAQLADLVLPVTYFMEETDIIYSSMWHPYMYYNQKLVSRYYEAKPEFEIYSMLAQRMGITDFPQLNEEQWIDNLIEGSTKAGTNLDELKQCGYAYPTALDRIPWRDYQFKTPSGKFEFIGGDALENCFNHNNKTSGYPFKLVTIHTKESLHSQHLMTSEISQPIVNICSEDAETLDIKDKEIVMLYNEFGTMNAEIHLSPKGQKGMLFMKEGWWFKNGGSVNSLTPHDVSDIGDQAIYNECVCNIKKQV